MQKQTFFVVSILCLLLFAASTSWSATQIAVTGSPPAFTINTAVAGSQPTTISNASTTYSVQTATAGRKITGKLSIAMPSNVTLQVRLTAPAIGTSAGYVTMTTRAANLVTGVTAVTNTTGLSISYNLSATSAAAKVTNSSTVLTLTIL